MVEPPGRRPVRGRHRVAGRRGPRHLLAALGHAADPARPGSQHRLAGDHGRRGARGDERRERQAGLGGLARPARDDHALRVPGGPPGRPRLRDPRGPRRLARAGHVHVVRGRLLRRHRGLAQPEGPPGALPVQRGPRRLLLVADRRQRVRVPHVLPEPAGSLLPRRQQHAPREPSLHGLRRRRLRADEGPAPAALPPRECRAEHHPRDAPGVAGAQGGVVRGEPALLRVRAAGRRSPGCGELPAHRGLPRRGERDAAGPPGEGPPAARRRDGGRSGSGGAQAGARLRAGRIGRCREPEPGLPFRARGRVPDDGVQRALGMVAPESGPAPPVAAHGPPLGDPLPPVRAPGHGGRILEVRVPERRGPLREPGDLRAGAAGLPVHRRVRRGHGRWIRVRGSRKRDPQVPGRSRCHDRHRHAADPARSRRRDARSPTARSAPSATAAPAARRRRTATSCT